MGEANMEDDGLQRYKDYLLIMAHINKLFDEGIIDTDDYSKLESMFALKYGVPDDSLCRYKLISYLSVLIYDRIQN